MSPSRRIARRWPAIPLTFCLGLVAAVAGPGRAVEAATTPRGPVTVLYAGSLTDVMEQSIGPAFQRATGFTLNGTAAGSSQLASGIKSGFYRGDVFISAAAAVNTTLEGPENGNWVQWYAGFARSNLVLGYNPKSAFAADLLRQPWYKVVTRPGFRLGRTDPVLDPKGALSVLAVNRAAKLLHDPSLRSVLAGDTNVYPEEDLVGRLQTGQIDGGFFYAAEAKAAGIATVPLTPVTLSATYTVTVLRRAPNLAGARAFIAFLLGPTGTRILHAAGVEVIKPAQLHGKRVPSNLRVTFEAR